MGAKPPAVGAAPENAVRGDGCWGGSQQRHIPHSHVVKSQITCDTNPAPLAHTGGEASHGNIAVASRAVGVVTEVQVPSACSMPRWLL